MRIGICELSLVRVRVRVRVWVRVRVKLRVKLRVRSASEPLHVAHVAELLRGAALREHQPVGLPLQLAHLLGLGLGLFGLGLGFGFG